MALEHIHSRAILTCSRFLFRLEASEYLAFSPQHTNLNIFRLRSMYLPASSAAAMNPTLPAMVSTSDPYPLATLREQFRRPSDVMSVLLLIGGEVIRRALAQLSGRTIAPVAFSFGWVNYAVTLVALGENKLMPPPDSSGLVINSKSGYVRQNNSWILGRIIRDYEYWRDERILKAERKFLEEARLQPLGTEAGANFYEPHVALSVAIYEVSANPRRRARVPDLDWLYYSGVLCAVVQLGVAAIPWWKWGDWAILMTTAIGITFALASGSLPQWKEEKFNCRKGIAKTVTLTRGNGHQDGCVVILGGEGGLDLEDLATGRGFDKPTTRIYTSIMAALWIALLIAVSGLKENTWFLLVVGIIGMLQNALVCRAERSPSAFGIHLEYKETIVDGKVMKTLMKLEETYPHVGRSLLETYFPGKLRAEEEQWWEQAKKKAKMGAGPKPQQAQEAPCGEGVQGGLGKVVKS